jgi:hypothetical protein
LSPPPQSVQQARKNVLVLFLNNSRAGRAFPRFGTHACVFEGVFRSATHSLASSRQECRAALQMPIDQQQLRNGAATILILI